MKPRTIFLTALACWVPLAPLALRQGYGAHPILLSFGTTLGVGWLALALARRVAADDASGGWAIRAGIVAFGLVVLQTLLLDRLHGLSATGYAIGAALCALLAGAIGRSRSAATPDATSPMPTVTVWSVGAIGALAAVAIGFAATHAPRTLYDAQSYHLFFSGRWLQDHALSILQTPFSDIAQAYAPANGEIAFLWQMAPWHGDFVARAGEFPFWLLAGVALYGISRRMGASPAAAWYPAAFFLCGRLVVEQAVGADVDVVLSATFASAVYLGLVAVDRNRSVDWALWGVAVGLALGTKYLTLVYLPILLTMTFAYRLRPRALWALPGIILFGAGWYVRNWILAGSPIYPSSFGVLGVTLAQGAFTRAAMLSTVFHASDWHLFPWVVAHAVGVTVACVALPLAVAGGLRAVARGWWPHGWLVAAPVAMTALFWVAVPVNVDGRFLMPAVALGLVPIAGLFGTSRSWNAVLHGLCLAGLAWVFVGRAYDPAPDLPWFMGGWFELNGLISPNSLRLVAGLTALFGVLLLLLRRSPWLVPVAALVVVSTGSVLAWTEDTACAPDRCDRLHVTDPFIRPGLIRTWTWMDANVHHATVAYTGVNLPYPLSGERLTNRVLYVNIDGHPDWRFHDYDRAYRSGRFEPVPPPLATSSGELVPLPARTGPRDDAIRPRYERLEGIAALWVHNLQRLGVNYVFIARLSAYEIDYQAHGPDGFPIEDQWAQADPATFTMVHDDQDARVYAVKPEGRQP
jgi:hypothetical protein